MEFVTWLQQQGCEVEITQDAEESGGYLYLDVRAPVRTGDITAGDDTVVLSDPYRISVDVTS